jgi:hypothetical protein
MPEWLACLCIIAAWVLGYRTCATVGRIKEKLRIQVSLRRAEGDK